MWNRTKTGREAASGLGIGTPGTAVKKGPSSPRAGRGLDCAPRPEVALGHRWAGRGARDGRRKGHGRGVEGLQGVGVWAETGRGEGRCTGAKKATAWVAFALLDGG